MKAPGHLLVVATFFSGPDKPAFGARPLSKGLWNGSFASILVQGAAESLADQFTETFSS